MQRRRDPGKPIKVQPAAQRPDIFSRRSLARPDDSMLGVVLDDKYRIIKKIGSGGMGEVYLAAYTKSTPEREVAVKVLGSPSYNFDSFQTEVMAAAAIGHENVVSVFGCGRTPDGSPYIAMEYLKGTDLGRMLEGGRRLDWPMAKGIILQACDALRAAHQSGVVHLDVKPLNVFLVDDGGKYVVKVLDFGIAKLSEDVAGVEASPAAGFVGTPPYAPPEQARGSKECDHRSDVYTVGVMLYEMLCGRLPFTSDASDGMARFREFVAKHREAEPPPFSAHGPTAGIPDGVEAVVMRCLAKKKKDRFQSMDALMEALLAIGRQQQAVKMPDVHVDEEDERPQRRLQDRSSSTGLVAALGIAAIAAALWAYYPRQGEGTAAAKPDAGPAIAVKPDASVEHPAEQKQRKDDKGAAKQQVKPHAKHAGHRAAHAQPKAAKAAQPSEAEDEDKADDENEDPYIPDEGTSN